MAGFLAFMFLLSQALASGGDYWVQYWVDKNQVAPGKEDILRSTRATEESSIMASIKRWFESFYNDEYFDIYVFGFIVLLTVIVSFSRSYMFFTVSTNFNLKTS